MIATSSPTVVHRPFAKSFVRYGERNERVVCVTNDLTASCEADDFRDAFPDRYFSLGMAEQNLVGVLAGLAREGFLPFYPSFGVFVTRRPWEQIALSVAYANLPVRLIGFLPGITTPGGVTHQAIDDVALMRLMPNMTVLEVGDATEVETILDVIDEIDGPVYCRMLRGQVPRLFDEPIALGRSRQLTEGDDVLVLSSGICTDYVRQAVAVLEVAGVSVEHRHVSTLKPFDDAEIETSARRVRHGVVAVENHLVSGGLGTAVCELVASRGIHTTVQRLGIADTYTHGGQLDFLLRYYGLGPVDVVRIVGALVGRDDLAAIVDPEDAPAASGRQRVAVAEGL